MININSERIIAAQNELMERINILNARGLINNNAKIKLLQIEDIFLKNSVYEKVDQQKME